MLRTDQRAHRTYDKNKMLNSESYNGAIAKSMVSLAAVKGSSAPKASPYLKTNHTHAEPQRYSDRCAQGSFGSGLRPQVWKIGNHVDAAHSVASFYPAGIRIDRSGECLIEHFSKPVTVIPERSDSCNKTTTPFFFLRKSYTVTYTTFTYSLLSKLAPRAYHLEFFLAQSYLA